MVIKHRKIDGNRDIMNLYNIINSYLYCSYLPPAAFPTWLSDCITPEIRGVEYSPDEAAARFDALFDKLIEQTSSERHVIPLSGGWDSRAILGALLERVEPDQISTVTFGVPGQLDYDIGNMVAESVGVQHHAIDLRKVDFTWEAIRESVKGSPWTYVPDGYFNSLSRNLFSSEKDAIWSGFLGGLTGGNHLFEYQMNHGDYLAFFSSHQKRCNKHQLCQPGFAFSYNLPFPEKNIMIRYDDALHQGIRQTRAIAPIVLPVHLWQGWNPFIAKDQSGAQVIAPFADPTWAGYWLNAPREVRKGQTLYLEMLNMRFPELFALPGKADFGVPRGHRLRSLIRRGAHLLKSQVQRRAPWLRVRSTLMANYLDYDEMFRTREDYQVTLAAAFAYLKDEEVVPWLDLDLLWSEHMRRRRDHGDAFCVLIGLAANLVENPFVEVSSDDNNISGIGKGVCL